MTTSNKDLEVTRAKFRETMERQRTAVQQSVPVKAKEASEAGHRDRIARPSIRLTEDDLVKVREAMGHALALNQTLNVTEVLRLALHDWDFAKLTEQKIKAIRSQDGRRTLK